MENEAPEAIYISLNQETNALDYLEHATVFIRETPKNVKAWKWVVISLHGALYGFAVAASCSADSDTSKTKTGKLLGFWETLKKCQDFNHMGMLVNSKHLELTDSQKESIESLKKKLRNEFEHFRPKSWSIEIHGMPQITINILEVIHFLARETCTYVHLSRQEEELVDKLVEETARYIKETDLYKETILAKKLSQNKEPASAQPR